VGLAKSGVFCSDTFGIIPESTIKQRKRRFDNGPRPGVREPQLGYDVQGSRIWATVICRDANIDIIGVVFVFCIL